MGSKAGSMLDSPRLALGVLVGAVLTYNNWFLGLALNRPLLLRGGAVSELSAVTQPHELVFRSLDIISGLLFILAALLIVRHMQAFTSRTRYALVFLTVLFGAANSADALLPLHCSETISSACHTAVNISLTHFTIPSHGYSSVIIAISYLVLPLTGLIFAGRTRQRAFGAISLVLVSIAGISLVAAIAEYVISHSFSERAWGPSQELQMFAIGLWFIAWYMAVFPLQKNVSFAWLHRFSFARVRND